MNNFAAGVIAALLIIVVIGLAMFVPALIVWWVWNSEIQIFWSKAPMLEYWSVWKLMFAAGIVANRLIKSSVKQEVK